MLKILILLAILGLTACKSSQSSDDYLSALKEAGCLEITAQERKSDSIRPNAWEAAYSFEITEVSPKGGQIIFFSEPSHGEAMFAYYDALKALAGPYLYLSDDKMILLQLNSGLQPETAKKIKNSLF